MTIPSEPVAKPNGQGLMRIYRAFVCSMQGFRDVFKYEAAFRQELLLVVILLPISFFIASSIESWLALVFSLVFVLFAELINSALEALADKVCIEHDPLIGRCKDIGSALVFVAFAWLILLWGVNLYQFILS
ncbi:diacylglycerol kinase [Thalassotalea mangrovi]|uniref:Diacylglycerol kinase n=1 Tax=Thalassotalea mangrovi TaxID=2572245 RepID=A0A4U1B3A4_9GAMM|nr:diacylglycerol kinase [Thalassotalea mangrovi]TKB43626.1 diacylglycerol kinase [Thalassotalea mangrovi]